MAGVLAMVAVSGWSACTPSQVMTKLRASPVIHQRLGQPSMLGGDWSKPYAANEYSAEYRAQRRAMRKRQVMGISQPEPRTVHPEPAHPEPAHPEPAFDGSRMGSGDGSWVMVFNAGQENEGVYSQADNEQQWILAFECTDDANRFAQDLSASGFDRATPVYWSADRLSTFLRFAKLNLWTVPRGTEIAPPASMSNIEPPSDGIDRRGDPERMYPAGDSVFDPARRDPYTTYRLWLDDLLEMDDGCGDDDCTIR